MTRRKRRRFTDEQRAEAVRLVRETGNLAKVARDLDLVPSCLRNWVKQAEVDEAGGGGDDAPLTTDEKKEIQRLKRENRRLEQERDFLKKAAAFFAREQDRRTR